MSTPRRAPFRGTAPALVTPFQADGTLDEPARRGLIDFQIAGSLLPDGTHLAGVEALVTLGTTGENPTVSHVERRRIVALTIGHTAGRVPVIVGAGTNDTAQSVVFAQEAAAARQNARVRQAVDLVGMRLTVERLKARTAFPRSPGVFAPSVQWGG